MLNKAMLDKLLAMPDDRLLAMLGVVLGSRGVHLPAGQVDETTIRRIRSLLSAVTDDDLTRIGELAELYQKGG